MTLSTLAQALALAAVCGLAGVYTFLRDRDWRRERRADEDWAESESTWGRGCDDSHPANVLTAYQTYQRPQRLIGGSL